jgi:teichuronic acid biosynthesis glycosyltransferase TuaC
MKVLFVFRESPNIKNYLIRAQADSIINTGIDIEYFTISKGGISGYLKAIIRLRKQLRTIDYDLVHAHYSFSGILVSLVSNKPVITSLMGSDIKKHFFMRLILHYFYQFSWDEIIVKSKKMKDELKFAKSFIIPNGVDLKMFYEIDKNETKKRVKFDKKINLIFLSFEKISKVKNYDLARKAFDSIKYSDKALHIVSNIEHNQLLYYYNAADAIILTSFSEGSPNVIKEAMACNCPIVSTAVGDVQEVIGNTEGCYIASFDPSDVAEKIQMAIEFSIIKGRTNGHQRIIELGLDSNSIAKRIVEVYKKALNA